MKFFNSSRLLLVAVAGALGSACNTVEFYEMAAFTYPVMEWRQDRANTHLKQKCVYSTEGSAGGIGSSSGGGCGCY
jgi:hypothetical protein